MLPGDNSPDPEQADYDELNYVYFDNGLNDYDDEYDRYEDYYLETGNDPYGLFIEVEALAGMKAKINRVLARVSRLKTRVLNWLHARPSADVDDIPF